MKNHKQVIYCVIITPRHRIKTITGMIVEGENETKTFGLE